MNTNQDLLRAGAKMVAQRLGCEPKGEACAEHPQVDWNAEAGQCQVAVLIAEDAVTTMQTEPDEAMIERAARALFEDPICPAEYSWDEMVAEDPGRADLWRSDAGRILKAAGLAAPVLDEGKIAEIVNAVIDRRPYRDGTRFEIRGLEHAVARAVVEALGGAR